MTVRACALCDRVLGVKPGPARVETTVCNTCLPRLLKGVKAIGADDATNNTNETETTR